MKNIAVTGGTDGVGRAVAIAALRRGHSVLVVGSSAAKGRALLDEAARNGVGDRLEFIAADLRLISENGRLLDELHDRFTRLDRLVLCAQRYRTVWATTSEGIEENFALTYLSRFILSYGARDLLVKGDDPAIVNVCGTGTPIGRVQWDNLRFTVRRSGFSALMQANRASDLLGVAFARHGGDQGVRFVLYNPDFVRTNLQRKLDQPWRTVALALVTVLGKPIGEGVRPLLDIMDRVPQESLSAFRGRHRIDMGSRVFSPGYDPIDARRLRSATDHMLAEQGRQDLRSS